jgi:hypothetical protein
MELGGQQMSKRWIIPLGLILLFVVGVAGTALASSSGDYALDWYTIDGGGGTSTGGDYSLSGTIGQPDAGTHTGGEYALTGGFWNRFVAVIYDLFLPLIAR